MMAASAPSVKETASSAPIEFDQVSQASAAKVVEANHDCSSYWTAPYMCGDSPRVASVV